jgi:uncharacterized protein (TIGR02594 family)
MVLLRKFGRPARVVMLGLSSIIAIALATPASARPSRHHHHHGRHLHHHSSSHHHRHHSLRRHHVSKHHRQHRHGQHHGGPRGVRHAARAPNWNAPDWNASGWPTPNWTEPHRAKSHRAKQNWTRHARRLRRHHVANAQASIAPTFGHSGFSGSRLVAVARRYIGGNPTGRRRLWCAAFMNMVLKRAGYHGTGSNMARSFAHYGRRISGPRIGAIAVMSRRGGGHVGVVSGIDSKGNPIIVSGNHGHKVAEAVYPRGRVYAYVMPPG